MDPQPDDIILDIGCGDGILTADIASRCKQVVGLDSSTSMIRTAKDAVCSKHDNASFMVLDCRYLTARGHSALQKVQYDKVFSNAAMHWILRDPTTRLDFFSDVFALLKPGGSFVFEMGGAGNVAEVHAALISVLCLRYDIPMEKIKAADPWFFPSDDWMTGTLEKAGFNVRKMETEYRPTQATMKSQDGSGGLQGWIRLMGASFLELLGEGEERDRALSDVCRVLGDIVTREDGSQWLGYVRLRAIAAKP